MFLKLIKINLPGFLKICMIFLLGFLFANIINFYMVYGLENPFSGNFKFLSYNLDKAPSNFINEDQIEIYPDKVVIKIPNTSLGRYAPTGSMKPILDENSNGIRIVPKTAGDIKVGDIITFQQNEYLIVHRVIEKGIDSEGDYFITKGDNNSVNDGKIRFKDIKFLTIGILW
jgi:hypothetical protein